MDKKSSVHNVRGLRRRVHVLAMAQRHVVTRRACKLVICSQATNEDLKRIIRNSLVHKANEASQPSIQDHCTGAAHSERCVTMVSRVSESEAEALRTMHIYLYCAGADGDFITSSCMTCAHPARCLGTASVHCGGASHVQVDITSVD